MIVPALSARLRAKAPRLQLSILPFGRGDAVDALGEGRTDLSLGFIWDRPDWVSGEHLYDEDFLIVGRPSALPNAPNISIEDYCAADHVLISPAGELRGVVDRRLEDMGLARRVVLGLPAFLPGLAAVAASDALITLPGRIARAFAPGFGLVSVEPPIEIRSFPVSVFWHRRNDADPQTVWLRQQILSCVAD